MTFFNSTGGLRGFKRSLYEGGVRSPTLMRWPETIESGRRSSLRWAFWDVLPTLVDLAGIDKSKVPSDIDGVSIASTIKGQEEEGSAASPPRSPRGLFFTW